MKNISLKKIMQFFNENLMHLLLQIYIKKHQSFLNVRDLD